MPNVAVVPWLQTTPPVASHASMQTETESPPLKVEMEIQTEPVELSRPVSPDAEAQASSSSSTVLPPTPMSRYLAAYTALSPSSSRTEVAAVLQSITDGLSSPLAVSYSLSPLPAAPPLTIYDPKRR